MAKTGKRPSGRSSRARGASDAPSRSAKETAFRLLSRRSHSRLELSRKLEQRGFDTADVASAMALCERLGYLDDDALARRWRARLQEKGYGALRIRKTLAQKGFNPEQIDGAFSGYDAASEEAALAYRVLTARMRSGGQDPGDRKAREKWYRFLCSRGFSRSDALAALNRLPPRD